MTKKKEGAGGGCCQVTSLVSVDERGQMILPKEIRERAGIKAGDKLALVAWEKDGAICCLTLIKADGARRHGQGKAGAGAGRTVPGIASAAGQA